MSMGESTTRDECKMEVDKVKNPSRCFACFKPGRKLFCHTLINDDTKVPTGETWLCRKCQTTFEDWRENCGNYRYAKREV